MGIKKVFHKNTTLNTRFGNDVTSILKWQLLALPYKCCLTVNKHIPIWLEMLPYVGMVKMYQSVWKPENVDLGSYNITEYLSLFWDLFHQLGFHAVTLGFSNTYSAPSVHLLVFMKTIYSP